MDITGSILLSIARSRDHIGTITPPPPPQHTAHTTHTQGDNHHPPPPTHRSHYTHRECGTFI